MNWIIYAMLGMISLGIMSLLLKKLTIENLRAEVMLLFLFIFAAVFYLLQILVTKTQIKINYFLIFLIIAAALFSYIGNLFLVKSIAIAPNPAYSIAIISLQTILVAVGSYFIFNSQLTVINLLGVVLGLIAIILLSL
ncbi:EamA family transporter [Candidatus Woesearchaeota archaeon]|nr:EamA family transporter [Candidatus Woesearchaeota archaeon]